MRSAAEFGAHGLCQGRGFGVDAVGLEPTGLAVSTDEAEKQGLGSGSGAVLDGEAQALIGTADEVTGGVVPGVQIGATAQGLAEVAAGAFCHVVDEDDGEVVAAVELTEEAEEARDV